MSSRTAHAPWISRPLDRERAGAFKVELVNGIEGLRSLESDWRRLAGDTEGDNPFLAWEWVFTWAEHMMAGRLVTAVVREGDEVLAIAPLYRNRYSLGPGVKATSLQLYGPREMQTVFELRQIPMSRGRESAVIRSLLGGLVESSRWDWIELGDYGTQVARWREVLAAPPRSLRLVAEETFEVPILHLLPTWDAQRSELRRNVKERIRRGYNRLKRDGLSPNLRVESDTLKCGERLEEFHRLHGLRAQVQDRKAHNNSFRDPRLRGFLAAAARRLMYAGTLSFAELDVGGDVVATRMLLERGKSLYLYYSGFDPAWWDRSVMTVLVTEICKYAIDRRASTVNFSPGLDQFKSGWTEPDGNLTSAAFMIGRQTPGARFRLAAFRGRKRVTWAVKSRAREAARVWRSIGRGRNSPVTNNE